MTKFKTEAELAAWLKVLEEVYEQSASRLWLLVTSTSVLATASIKHLCDLGIPPIHTDNIKERAGEQHILVLLCVILLLIRSIHKGMLACLPGSEAP
jgi:hypothetical protein